MRIPLRLLLTTVVATLCLGLASGSALAAPANDDFANAESLSGNRGAIEYDMTGATNQVNEPLAGAPSDITTWYRYSPSANGFATFSTCRTEADLSITGHSISVYAGSALSALSSETTSNGGCLNDRVNVATQPFAVEAGHDYWVQFEAASTTEITGGQFNYDFNAAIPTNDDFADASSITGPLPQTIAADNGLATIESGEISTSATSPRNSLWYRWTPDQDGTVSIDTCSSDLDPSGDSRLHIYTDDDPDPDVVNLAYATDSDDNCAAPHALLSHAYLTVTSGATYYVRLGNYSDDFGRAFELNLRWVGSPESTIAPAVGPSSPRFQVGDVLHANEGSWVADPAVTGTTIVWKLCNAAGASCIVIDGETDSEYTVQPDDFNHTFRIVVTATNGVDSQSAESPASSVVDSPPANDNFADATNLGSGAISLTDDNYFATSEPDENTGATWPVDHSVWYRWTAPATKTYLVDNCPASGTYNFAINVYADSGAELADQPPINAFEGSCDFSSQSARTYFAAQAGATYLIQAGSREGEAETDFTLTIHEAPAPSFFQSPTLTGDAVEDLELALEWVSANSGTPNSDAYEWALCDAEGGNCTTLENESTDLALTATMVDKRVRATVTLTNANGSSSESVLSGVILGDQDHDGVTDPSDTCPTEAGTRANGCLPSELQPNGVPVISGSTVVGQQLSSTTGAWIIMHDPLAYSVAYEWQRCASVAGSCTPIPLATNATYMLTANDLGKVLRVLVTASNADDSAAQTSTFTAAIAAAPVTEPPAEPPPITPPTDPFPQPTVPKSLGKVRLSPKNTITLSKLNLLCGQAATGACAGSITFTTAKSKRARKTIKPVKLTAKLRVSPGKKLAPTFKLNAPMVKAIKAAKSLKTSVVIKLGAPGFSVKTVATSVTVSPR